MDCVSFFQFVTFSTLVDGHLKSGLYRFLLLGRNKIDDLDTEKQGGVGRDRTHSTISISKVRWADNFSLGTLGQTQETLVPALDNLICPNFKGEWLITIVARIKLCAI
jgi:hypothetical protein